ncbi:hypothetical protein PanWU01x14_066120 [Parasponia andersonii]|uniref:Uncharacterized protein n=1 Tax=Parasponia andersonii TaxID=3476 RepID=A0A2P5DG09_PARAD|nr:hypothetical protein PanWU01x14_066120 [Parasponia andersonii]
MRIVGLMGPRWKGKGKSQSSCGSHVKNSITASIFFKPIRGSGMEEVFYLYDYVKCLKIVDEDKRLINDETLWLYMKSKKETFPDFYKAYCHLRKKN